jgi:hypothetical protein
VREMESISRRTVLQPGFFEKYNSLGSWNQFQACGPPLSNLEFMTSLRLFRTVDDRCWNAFKNVQHVVSQRLRVNRESHCPSAPGIVCRHIEHKLRPHTMAGLYGLTWPLSLGKGRIF